MTPDQMQTTEAVLHGRWKSLGFDGLPREERDFVILWALIAEVNTGSFHQYFFNSSGDTALEAMEACDRIGAEETLRILAGVLSVFDAIGGYTIDRYERQERMKALNVQFNAFDGSTVAFHENYEDILELALDRVHQFYVTNGIAIPHA